MANLVCFFLVSRQLVLLLTFSKISAFISWSKIVRPSVLVENFISTDVNSFYSSFPLTVQISLPYKRIGNVRALYFVLEISGPNLILKVQFKIPGI